MHAKLSALKPITAPLLVALALGGCVEPVNSAFSRHPTYSVDLAGKAASCTAAPVALKRGEAAAATIATSGGGWCGVPVTQGGEPLVAGLLTQPPRSGKVYIHTVGDETRVDYTPSGAVTADAFTVKFIPGDETMRVTVSQASASAAK